MCSNKCFGFDNTETPAAEFRDKRIDLSTIKVIPFYFYKRSLTKPGKVVFL